MGQARRRSERRLSQLAKQPWCVYCGGETRGDTIDHMPPITIFDRRRRPKDLEFTSCAACNSGGRGDDQIVGMLSRMFPTNPETGVIDDDLRTAVRGVANNHPGLLEEMWPRPDQLERLKGTLPGAGHPLNASGPVVTAGMTRFAARFGLALHFHHSGRIVPLAGRVAVRWLTNFDIFTRGISDDLLALVGPPKTLRQGRFEVADQFLFPAVVSDDRGTSAHLATFRKSFAVVAWVSEDGDLLADLPPMEVYRPGFLKG